MRPSPHHWLKYDLTCSSLTLGPLLSATRSSWPQERVTSRPGYAGLVLHPDRSERLCCRTVAEARLSQMGLHFRMGFRGHAIKCLNIRSRARESKVCIAVLVGILLSLDYASLASLPRAYFGRRLNSIRSNTTTSYMFDKDATPLLSPHCASCDGGAARHVA